MAVPTEKSMNGVMRKAKGLINGAMNGKANGVGRGDYHHAMGVEEFRRHGREMVDLICDYYSSMEDKEVLSNVQPGYLEKLLPSEAPETGEPFGSIMQDVEDKIMPGMTHWQSPNFFAYFPATSSFPAILGDMLSTALNIIGFSWKGCPAATDLEVVVLDWFAKLLNLPPTFLSTRPDGSKSKGGGVIQGSASEACLVALLAAKCRKMQGRAPEDVLKLVAYSSDQAHSCLKKACIIAGIQNTRIIPARREDAWALNPEAFERAVLEDLNAGLLPFFLCANVGTTSTCAVDPLDKLGPITQQHNIWLHTDAAFAGVAAMLPELADYFKGLELVDSFDTNPHKWLLTNFDCSTLYLKDATYLKLALTLNPAFLVNANNDSDFKDWQVPLGRRFRSLKLWFVLRTYGAEGLRSYLRHHIGLAKDFAAKIEADPRFVLAAPQNFSLVCFQLAGCSNAENGALLDAINESHKTFLIHTELEGKVVLRLAVGSTLTQKRHVDAVWQLLSEKADKILSQKASA